MVQQQNAGQAASAVPIQVSYADKDATIAALVQIVEKQQEQIAVLLAAQQASASQKPTGSVVQSLWHEARSGVVGNTAHYTVLTVLALMYAYFIAHPATVIATLAVSLYAFIVGYICWLVLRSAVRNLMMARQSGGIIAFWNVLFFYSSILAITGCKCWLLPDRTSSSSFGLLLLIPGVCGALVSFFVGGFRAASAGQKFPNRKTIWKFTDAPGWNLKDIIARRCRRICPWSLGGQCAR